MPGVNKQPGRLRRLGGAAIGGVRSVAGWIRQNPKKIIATALVLYAIGTKSGRAQLSQLKNRAETRIRQLTNEGVARNQAEGIVAQEVVQNTRGLNLRGITPERLREELTRGGLNLNDQTVKNALRNVMPVAQFQAVTAASMVGAGAGAASRVAAARKAFANASRTAVRTRAPNVARTQMFNRAAREISKTQGGTGMTFGQGVQAVRRMTNSTRNALIRKSLARK